MKECLHCKKQFQEKRDTAKYCSDSCRVMFNRKHPKPKKEGITELKMEVLYNSILDLITNHKSELPKDFQDIKQIGVLKSNGDIEPMFSVKPKIRRSFENYQQLKLDCESPEVWAELKAEILASDLPQRQKTLLTT